MLSVQVWTCIDKNRESESIICGADYACINIDRWSQEMRARQDTDSSQNAKNLLLKNYVNICRVKYRITVIYSQWCMDDRPESLKTSHVSTWTKSSVNHASVK